jgi:hypothetical protein
MTSAIDLKYLMDPEKYNKYLEIKAVAACVNDSSSTDLSNSVTKATNVVISGQAKLQEQFNAEVALYKKRIYSLTKAMVKGDVPPAMLYIYNEYVGECIKYLKMEDKMQKMREERDISGCNRITPKERRRIMRDARVFSIKK